MIKLYYLAYGSNLHPARLKNRVPSAIVVGVAELPDKAVNFFKRSQDGSGKCNLIDQPASIAYGVLYELLASEKGNLDKAEGLGKGYLEERLDVSVNSRTYSAFTYIAASSHIDPKLAPYDWYRNMVLAGATYHRLPSTYIEHLGQTSGLRDPNPQRAESNTALVLKLTTPPNLN